MELRKDDLENQTGLNSNLKSTTSQLCELDKVNLLGH